MTDCQLIASSSSTVEECQEQVATLTAAVEDTRPEIEAMLAQVQVAYDKDKARYDVEVATVTEIVANLDLIEEIDDSNRPDLQWLAIYNRYQYFDPITIEHLRDGERDQLRQHKDSRTTLTRAMRQLKPERIIQLELLTRINAYMRYQSDAVKEEILQTTAAHVLLDTTLETRPELDFGNSKPFTAHVPLDVAGMVFEACDLESCVSLKQVSKSWWEAFHEHEPILKKKVIERTPWMEPEEVGTELKTWGDCALVVVGRLGNTKWVAVDSIDDVQVTGPAAKTNYIVSADIEEMLPEDFQLLKDNHRFDLDCHNLKLDVLNLEARVVTDKVSQKTIFVDTDKIVVSFVDKSLPTIVLPSPESLGINAATVKSSLSVSLGTIHIIVTLSKEDIYILPLEFPDFRQGHGLKYAAERGRAMSNYAFPNAVCVRLGNHEPDRKSQFLISDKHTNAMIPLYEGDTSSCPVSIYNGLIWVSKISPTATFSLVPIFVDLKDGKKYYRNDRIINGIETARFHLESGSSRYVPTSTHSSDIVDLATGVITLVRGDGETFTGFQDGYFNAWRYNQETVDRYKREMKRKWKNYPNQTMYDLSEALQGEEEYNKWGNYEDYGSDEDAAHRNRWR